MPGKRKSTQTIKPRPKNSYIYGIFDFEDGRLIHVGLDLAEVELVFDLGTYDEKRYAIVKFPVMIH